MKRILSTLTVLAAVLTLGSCQVEVREIKTLDNPGPGFTITASYGAPGTKAAFLDDGVSMTWTPGDILYMVDLADDSHVYFLETDITQPAKVARFHTDEMVSTGSYLVLYGDSELEVDMLCRMTSDLEELAGPVRLYATVDVTTGDTSAEITLHQMFSMLTFKFVNIPSGFDGGLNVGMAVSKVGLPYLGKGTVTPTGVVSKGFTGTYKTEFGVIEGAQAKTLVIPVDLSGRNIHFFVKGLHDGSDHVTYEFLKGGFKLVEGKNYSVTLDFNKATTVSTIQKRESDNALLLSCAADFRAAALWDSNRTFHPTADIDFTGQDYFPINGSLICDEGSHTLSGINASFSECDYVGVTGEGNVENLNVAGSTFVGRDCVGAIAGMGGCNGCNVSSTTVSGRNKVGGLVGDALNTLAFSSFTGDTAAVTGEGKVGGIVGRTGDTIIRCTVRCDVTGSGDEVGGIAGESSNISRCSFEGNVTGKNMVGGVSGTGLCMMSCSIGDVTGEKYVGGVSGCFFCKHCYHIGDVTGTDPRYVAGISGDYKMVASQYCYSYGTVSNGIGICEDDGGDTNLTSCNALYYATPGPADNCNCGPAKPFMTMLDKLNAGGSYFVPLCVPGYEDAGCPMLEWQFEGFGDEIEIPGFEIVEL